MIRRRVAARIAITAALLLGGVGCTDDDNGASRSEEASDEPAKRGEFLLLSYNVAGLPQVVSEVNPEKHLPLISPKLEPYDVVLTQEDFDWWVPQVEELQPTFPEYHRRLRAKTTHEYATKRHPGPEAVGVNKEEGRAPPFVGDGLGMLSRLRFDDVERVPWVGCFGGLDTSDGGAADCLSMKGFAVATFRLEAGVEIDVYTAHAEAGSTPDDNRIRARNFQQLATFINQRSDGRAVIIAGDMNLHLEPDHERRSIDEPIWLGFLEDAGLTDVCAVVDCEQPGAIDKAAFRSAGGVEIEPLKQSFPVAGFKAPDGEDLSDHPPLEVRFRWSAG